MWTVSSVAGKEAAAKRLAGQFCHCRIRVFYEKKVGALLA
jgi:hypothetical protein